MTTENENAKNKPEILVIGGDSSINSEELVHHLRSKGERVVLVEDASLIAHGLIDAMNKSFRESEVRLEKEPYWMLNNGGRDYQSVFRKQGRRRR